MVAPSESTVRSLVAAFCGYEPQCVTSRSLRAWLAQFPNHLQDKILSLLEEIRFVSKAEVKKLLMSCNDRVLKLLEQDGIQVKNVIYTSIGSAGSSSGVMLNLLRNAANLGRRRAHLVDQNNIRGIQETTSKLEFGSIVYVDDFSGTGNQFVKSHRESRIGDYIPGNFSEFFIAACICEEALDEIRSIGVEPIPGFVHKKSERPLHPESSVLDSQVKGELVQLCRDMHQRLGLGYGELATMVVLFNNAPNTVPMLFRGTVTQDPYRGLFPRTDDLPFEQG